MSLKKHKIILPHWSWFQRLEPQYVMLFIFRITRQFWTQ